MPLRTLLGSLGLALLLLGGAMADWLVGAQPQRVEYVNDAGEPRQAIRPRSSGAIVVPGQPHGSEDIYAGMRVLEKAGAWNRRVKWACWGAGALLLIGSVVHPRARGR